MVVLCVSVELASEKVRRELDEIQRRLTEFLTSEEDAMEKRIRYDI